MTLNANQSRFVGEYLIDLNATQAAIRAGYSAKTAVQQGSRLLMNADIQQAIEERQKVLQQRTEITQESVILELAKIAFGDQRRVMSWGPDGIKLRPSNALTDDEAAVVAEVTETVTANGGSLKIKTHDKVAALKLLGEHLGLFKQKVELTGKDGGPVQQTQVTPEQLAEAVRSVQSKF